MDSIRVRRPRPQEREAVNAMILRSKAHWGYDADFMAQCVAELALSPDDLLSDGMRIADRDGEVVGCVLVACGGTLAEIEKLYVDPSAMGAGVGRRLMTFALCFASRAGAADAYVDADPGAAAFYRRMGFSDAGLSPSGSVPGRMLPRLMRTIETTACEP